jgi:DNA-directed RNA polymerase specialized sigma24 family protein
MDSDFFDTLFEKYWQQVYTSAFKRVVNADTATEVTQEAFFQLWLNKDQANKENILDFLLAAVHDEIFKLIEKECLDIVNPPGKIFEHMELPGAN